MQSTISARRSEGLPERDISSLGVMGWGLDVAGNSSRRSAAAAVANPGKGIRLGIIIDYICVK